MIQLSSVSSKGQHSLAKPCSCFHSQHVPFVLAAAGAVAEPPPVLSLWRKESQNTPNVKGQSTYDGSKNVNSLRLAKGEFCFITFLLSFQEPKGIASGTQKAQAWSRLFQDLVMAVTLLLINSATSTDLNTPEVLQQEHNIPTHGNPKHKFFGTHFCPLIIKLHLATFSFFLNVFIPPPRCERSLLGFCF